MSVCVYIYLKFAESRPNQIPFERFFQFVNKVTVLSLVALNDIKLYGRNYITKSPFLDSGHT